MHNALEVNGYHVNKDTLHKVIYDVLEESKNKLIVESLSYLTAKVFLHLVAIGAIATNPAWGIVMAVADMVFDAVSTGLCYQELLKNVLELVYDLVMVTSWDPNEKFGPAGLDPAVTQMNQRKRFIVSDHPLFYIIFFENVDLEPAISAVVEVTCTFDSASGHAEWLFRGKDPSTGELADFLPPNKEDIDPRGEGWVSYSVKPKSDLPTGTVIKNEATIDFEVDVLPAPMDTPEFFNTIDSKAPTSSVNALSADQSSTSFEVSWSGNDEEGSGIKGYTIYFSDNDGGYELWFNNTPYTSAVFTGEAGHSYRFYSIATDNVGNVEPQPSESDTITSVNIPSPDRGGGGGCFFTLFPQGQ